MTSVRLTRRARVDLADISRFTLDRWGGKQRDAYLEALDRRFRWLTEDPSRGRSRPEIADGCRSFPEGARMIVYRSRGGAIEILGVPHQAMDARPLRIPR